MNPMMTAFLALTTAFGISTAAVKVTSGPMDEAKLTAKIQETNGEALGLHKQLAKETGAPLSVEAKAHGKSEIAKAKNEARKLEHEKAKLEHKLDHQKVKKEKEEKAKKADELKGKKLNLKSKASIRGEHGEDERNEHSKKAALNVEAKAE